METGKTFERIVRLLRAINMGFLWANVILAMHSLLRFFEGSAPIEGVIFHGAIASFIWWSLKASDRIEADRQRKEEHGE